MRKRSILLLAGAAAIVASLVVGPAATAGSDKASAGTVVFIHDQEPPNLQHNWVGNTLYATASSINSILVRRPDPRQQRELGHAALHGQAQARQEEPADDAVHVQPEGGLVATASPSPVRTSARRGRSGSTRRTTSSRSGYEDIKSVKCKGKTGIVIFKKVYANWETLV